MTTRRLLTLDDFVKKPTTYIRFGEKVTKNPIDTIFDGGLLVNYKQLATEAKYIQFSGMQAINDGGQGLYIQDDTITEEEDIGVIIYIGEHRYRRLFAAWVEIDWFYTDDLSYALRRACKYASIRFTTGKTYNCHSPVTIKADVRQHNPNQQHGLTDFGHILIDMRGATVNYLGEEDKYCFNVRIYHRDTKFMLTNGTWNVTQHNISLINIANIVGGNNYTDMLTDMEYNVPAEKQPDTNRVVLITDPVIQGIKTFDGIDSDLNYLGSAQSGEANQAVTKNYMPENINEEACVELVNGEALGTTTFANILDRGGMNIVDENDVSNILLDAMTPTFQNIMTNAQLNIYQLGMYYTKHVEANAPVAVFGGNWDKQEYINKENVEVFKQMPADIAITPQQRCIVDENEVGIPVYLRMNLSQPITFKPDIIVQECESCKQIIENNSVTIINPLSYTFTGDKLKYLTLPTWLPSNLGLPPVRPGTSVEVMVNNYNYTGYHYGSRGNCRGDLFGLPHPTKFCSRWFTCALMYTATDNKNYIALGSLYNSAVETIYSSAGSTDGGIARIYSAIVDIYFGNYKFTYDWRKVTASSKWELGWNMYESGLLWAITTVNYTAYMKDTSSSAEIIVNDKNVKRINNLPFELTSYFISGEQYLTMLKQPEYFLKDYIENEDGTITIDHFYLRMVNPVQANLESFMNSEDTKPCAKVRFTFRYENTIINTKVVDFYIIRFVSEGIPQYEIPKDLNPVTLADANAIRYPVNFVYSNNTLSDFTYKIDANVVINDRSNYSLPEYIRRECSCGRSSKECRYPCSCGESTMTVTLTTVLGNTTSSVSSSATWPSPGTNRWYPDVTIPVLYVNIFNARICKTTLAPYTLQVNSGESKCIPIYSKMEGPHPVSYANLSKYISAGIDACGWKETSITLDMPGSNFYLSVLPNIHKNNMFTKIFGNQEYAKAYIMRDGILSQPLRHRNLRPEHAQAAPIGTLNP